MSVDEKRHCIKPEHPKLSVSRQCALIGLPRSSYYRQGNGGLESEENLELMRLIDEEYTRHPFYGSRKLRDYLHRQGYHVNRKRVRRLMRLMGLQAIYPKPKTTIPSSESTPFSEFPRNPSSSICLSGLFIAINMICFTRSSPKYIQCQLLTPAEGPARFRFVRRVWQGRLRPACQR